MVPSNEKNAATDPVKETPGARQDDARLPAGAQRLQEAAEGVGLPIEVIEYPDGTRTAADAAAAVGCEVDQIVKSMVFDADGELVLALTSGGNLVDTTHLARLAGATRCDRAEPESVRAMTGYAIGGVAPLGHRTPLRTWLDRRLLAFDTVWAAAGTPRHVFAVAPEALAQAASAVVADFTRD